MNEKWYEQMKNEVRTCDVYGFEHWTPDDPEELTIVDIGANVGAFTVWAAEKFPQAKIHAFELIKENYDFCIEKVKDFDNVIVENTAIVGKNAPIGVYKNKRNPGGHKPIFDSDTSTYLNKERFAAEWKETDVDWISFEQFIEQNEIEKIDFLKLDCEGSEYEIFQCIDENNLWDKVLNMSFEIHGPPDEQEKLLENIRQKFSSVYTTTKKAVYCRGKK